MSTYVKNKIRSHSNNWRDCRHFTLAAHELAGHFSADFPLLAAMTLATNRSEA
jgi:hypothetical protein